MIRACTRRACNGWPLALAPRAWYHSWRMTRWFRHIALIIGLSLVCGLALGLFSTNLPLGLPGEWTWSRLARSVEPNPLGVAIALVGILGFAGFVAWAGLWLEKNHTPSRLRVFTLLGALGLGSVVLQLVVQNAAPQAFGLTKWAFALHSPASSGYYTLARGAQLQDSARFWHDYPDWIRDQDALHVGTHPPGLFLLWREALGLTRGSLAFTNLINALAPGDVVAGFREIAKRDPIPPAERAAIVLMGFLTQIACALTVLPIYGMSRAVGLSRTQGLWAAALWPLVPSAVLFQPAADTMYPVIAASIIALALVPKSLARVAAGGLLAIGMQLTLAFLPVGLLAAIVVVLYSRVPSSAGGSRWAVRSAGRAILAIGLGFSAVTAMAWAYSGANPFVIWWWNQRNHARFYEQFPRNYAAWMLLNPVEFAVALGLPIVVWLVPGLRAGRSSGVAWATLAVLAALQISGRNLSEVARLWLLFMPMLLPAVASGIVRLGGREKTIAATLVLLGVQTLLLQATIQVVYAVAD